MNKTKSKEVKAWAIVDDNGKLFFSCGSRLGLPKNGKYQWYKYVVISDKKYGVLKQNGFGYKAVRVIITELPHTKGK